MTTPTRESLRDWYKFESVEQRNRLLSEWFPTRQYIGSGRYDLPETNQELVVVFLDAKVFDK